MKGCSPVKRDFIKLFLCVLPGDGQVDFNEFMTILGPKLLSSETREGFLGSTIDTIFWQVKLFILFLSGLIIWMECSTGV